ncbi:hypothetical protein AV654_17650 [Paenibacillus elgii]|uniref:Uncharacterized protein n=1 Tax=Paenibacillus elgii TaxID=189691 RepID=A0A161SEK6_9BACL|nr:hypothetical protein [Paenibacillus elgii]KZE79295.1 hypothetical protein AV654_17650 [Paenibacillus elgii]
MVRSEKWRWQQTPEAAVNAMEREHGKLLIDVQEVHTVAGASIAGLAFHELRIKALIDGSLVNLHEQVSVSWMRKWGILKRWDSFKKSESFLQSELGKRWLGYFLQECRPRLVGGQK